MFWKNDTHGCGKSTADYRNPEDITVLKLFTKNPRRQWNRQIPKHTSKSQRKEKELGCDLHFLPSLVSGSQKSVMQDTN